MEPNFPSNYTVEFSASANLRITQQCNTPFTDMVLTATTESMFTPTTLSPVIIVLIIFVVVFCVLLMVVVIPILVYCWLHQKKGYSNFGSKKAADTIPLEQSNQTDEATQPPDRYTQVTEPKKEVTLITIVQPQLTPPYIDKESVLC
eukprot:TRINITY_DN156_c1_g1_i5.p1 TRINITY_DN156_c1_g1~~TRINITY_DN156_c1_g1_i5.p1  ORF type:complete len:147 (-),score=21.80 TRINITY_DN156_c1_g1_i5:45-485(-)